MPTSTAAHGHRGSTSKPTTQRNSAGAEVTNFSESGTTRTVQVPTRLAVPRRERHPTTRRRLPRTTTVLVSSANRPFKGDEETFNPARPDAALDFDGGDRLELPALGSMLVEHVLELVADILPPTMPSRSSTTVYL